jgi:hypothetical protein
LRQIFLSVGLLIGVLAVCAVTYTIWESYSASRDGEGTIAQSIDPPPIETQRLETPAAGSKAASAETASPQTPESTVVGQAPAASAGLPGAASTTSPATPSGQPTASHPIPVAPEANDIHGAGNRELRLSASASTWVQAREGNRTVFVGVISPGETKVLKVNEGARLVVGNAGGLQVTWQGADAGVVGPAGQVRIVTVSSEGVSVAPPVRNAPSGTGAETSRENTR